METNKNNQGGATRYSEAWYVKRESNSEPEIVILSFENVTYADIAHHKAVVNNDARMFFGNDFPKEIASAWQ